MFLHDPYFLIRGGLYLAACEFLYRIYFRPRGPQEVFRASWSYRAIVWVSVVGSAFFLWQIAIGNGSQWLSDSLTWMFFATAAVSLAWFPGVILADEAGVEQRRLLRRRKRIPWSDVIAINQKWEESSLDPWSGGQRTALLGNDGTEICFSEWSVKQDRFEWWIRNHVPAQCFGAVPPKSITGNWP
jgi:hypothetical protein